MARRIRTTLANAFRRLPRNLARDIAIFLDPIRIENVQSLADLVEVYPTGYLSIVLRFSLNEEDRCIVAKVLSDDRHAVLTFDVSVYGTQGRLDTDLVRVLLRCARVEGLTLYNVSICIEENMDVFKDFPASKNSGHVVHFSGEREDAEESQRSMFERAQRVADFLRDDASLVSLNFRWSSVKIDPNLLRRAGFWGSLNSNRSLCYLKLYDVGLDSEDAVLLCEALNSGSGIEHLDIGANAIGDKGVLIIAQCLKKNTKLRSLIQDCVDATSRGGVAMAEALFENTTMELLSMKDDPLGPTAGKVFASMLKVNTSLRFLCLDYCDLETEGCRYFVDALAINRTLKVLRLNHNAIGPHDQSELVRVAKQAGVLTRLEVADKNVLVHVDAKPGHSIVCAYNFLGGSYLWHLRGQR